MDCNKRQQVQLPPLFECLKTYFVTFCLFALSFLSSLMLISNSLSIFPSSNSLAWPLPPLPHLLPQFPFFPLSFFSRSLPICSSSRKLQFPPRFTCSGACHAVLPLTSLPPKLQPHVTVSISDLTSLSFPLFCSPSQMSNPQ